MSVFTSYCTLFYVDSVYHWHFHWPWNGMTPAISHFDHRNCPFGTCQLPEFSFDFVFLLNLLLLKGYPLLYWFCLPLTPFIDHEMEWRLRLAIFIISIVLLVLSNFLRSPLTLSFSSAPQSLAIEGLPYSYIDSVYHWPFHWRWNGMTPAIDHFDHRNCPFGICQLSAFSFDFVLLLNLLLLKGYPFLYWFCLPLTLSLTMKRNDACD